MNKDMCKKEIISELQKNILQWEGFRVPLAGRIPFKGLEQIERSFPNSVFPTGAIHEFLSDKPEHEAATEGFISGLMNVLMQNGGICLWISTSVSVFPPALKAFGIEPDRIVFVCLNRQRDILWALEEALKCRALAAVVAEVQELSFAESRRLQLVVEKSRVTGFILRKDTRKVGSTTCVARWQITPLPSETEEGLPGLGFPRWNVRLLKARNGSPGEWTLEWHAGKFTPVVETRKPAAEQEEKRRAG